MSTHISMFDLKPIYETLGQNDLILDVRTEGEFSEGRVPGSRNIPVDQVMKYANELKKYDHVYIYCRAGGRAQTAWDILKSMGLNNLVCVDEGGFPNWASAGCPCEK